MRPRAPLTSAGTHLAVAGLQGRMNRRGAVTLKLLRQDRSMPSSMRDPWFVTGVLANLALGVVLAGLVLAPMYMALKWWIAHHHGLQQPRAKHPLGARF